jgi:uncharacterized cupredoxin-like copper-binding protein
MSSLKAHRLSPIPLVAVVLSLAALVVACGGGGGSSGGSGLGVSLDEWSVEVAREELQAGPITFAVANRGDRPHQFIIVKSDLPPALLPVEDSGRVQTSRLNVVSETGAFAAGESRDVALDITAGKYLLICNLSDSQGAGVVSHYRNGMVASLLVNP